MTLCANCGSQCAASDSVSCGICSLRFHLKCTKLSSSYLKLINSCKNVIYRCDVCSGISIPSCVAKLENALFSLKEIHSTFKGNTNLKKLKNQHPTIASNNTAANNVTMDKNNLIITRSKAKVVDLTNLSLNVSSNSVVADMCPNARNANTPKADNSVAGVVSTISQIGDIRSPAACSLNKDDSLLLCANSLADENAHADVNTSAAAAVDVVFSSVSTAPQPSSLNASEGLANNSAWTEVRNKKRKKAMVVVGSSDNTELSVAVRNKWVHLSSFAPTVTADDIKSYVEKHANIDRNSLLCFPLIKKDNPVDNLLDKNKLKRVNFKLGISSVNIDKILNAALWPANVRIRPFRFFQKQTVQSQPK